VSKFKIPTCSRSHIAFDVEQPKYGTLAHLLARGSVSWVDCQSNQVSCGIAQSLSNVCASALVDARKAVNYKGKLWIR